MTNKAFVTGASGFVGMNLVQQLCAAGWEVSVLARPSSDLSDLQGLDYQRCIGDVTDPESLQAAIPLGVNCVFHVAASTSVWSRHNAEQTQINVSGTQNMIDASIRAGAQRMIHTSSFVVWGFQEETINEDTPRQDNAHWINYVRSKSKAESLVRQAVAEGRLDAVIVNPAHILGPGDRHNWSRMIRMVDQGSLPGIPPGGGVFADVREIAAAQIRAFEHGRKGQNYLLGGEDATYLEVVSTVGEILNKKVPAKPMPGWLLRAVGHSKDLISKVTGKEPDITPESAAMITRHIRCDSSRAQKELGYRFTPIRQLLEDTCQWMREKQLIQ